jgi:hypothetical protein
MISILSFAIKDEKWLSHPVYWSIKKALFNSELLQEADLGPEKCKLVRNINEMPLQNNGLNIPQV